jgi:hypothetical protein
VGYTSLTLDVSSHGRVNDETREGERPKTAPGVSHNP